MNYFPEQNWSQNPWQLTSSQLNLEISSLGSLAFTLSFTGCGDELDDG